MKKIFALGVILLPAAGYGLDMAGCETIGYQQHTKTTCVLFDDCINAEKQRVAEFGMGPDDVTPERACMSYPHTEQECADKLARQNAMAAEHDFLVRCGATDARIADKKRKPEFATSDTKFVSTDGSYIDVADLITHGDFVYYTKVSPTVSAILSQDQEAWHVILGWNSDDGFSMATVD